MERVQNRVQTLRNQYHGLNHPSIVDVYRFLPLSHCVSEIDYYDGNFLEFFKGYDDGKYYLGGFEIAQEIKSILYNKNKDIFRVNLTGYYSEEDDVGYKDPSSFTIKHLNGGKYIIEGESQPYVACKNVKRVMP